MNIPYKEAIQGLVQSSWKVEYFSERQPLPTGIINRYPWIPSDYRELIEEVNLLCSPEEKAWFLTSADYSNTSDSDFAWNEWEKQSLGAAKDHAEWTAEIKKFWDQHFPVMMSLKSGYAYLAIEKETLQIICGEEPEYEETTVIASSVLEVLHMLAQKEPRLEFLL